MLNPKCHKLEATLFYMFANKAHNILCDWDAFKLRAHVGNVFVVSIYCIYSLFLKYICAMRQTCSKLRLNLCSAIEHLVLPACVGNFDFQFTVSTVGNLIVWWRVYVENILPILVIAIPLSLNFVLMVMCNIWISLYHIIVMPISKQFYNDVHSTLLRGLSFILWIQFR